jgi:hypothetical protein
MWRLWSAPPARHAAGLYRFEHARTLVIRGEPSETSKRGIVPATPWIVGMVVSAGRVGLPQFDHRVVHRRFIAVQHTTGNPDPFALHFWTGQTSRAVIHGEADMKKRTDGLRRRAFHINPRRA